MYRDFVEDHRISMEVYADNLGRSLESVTRGTFKISQYKPAIPEWMTSARIGPGVRIRLARYLSYPGQARRSQGSVNHILDQSYAHLLNAINPARSVITVHDLIPILAWKGLIPGLTYPHYPLLYKLTIASLHKARSIVAVSESTKRDLVTHCALDEGKITVVHNGLDQRFRSTARENRAALRNAFGLPDRGAHIVLITGGQSYKNHLTSFRVIARLQGATKKPLQLVWLGGGDSEYLKCMEKVDLGTAVIRFGHLPIERLVDLYNSVDCLLFPSWYEGFGWPPLEAMACGTPVVASNAASLPEIVADAALTAAPDDIDGLAAAVRRCLEDENLREEYVSRGYENVKRFTWDRCASDVAAIYQRIMNERQ